MTRQSLLPIIVAIICLGQVSLAKKDKDSEQDGEAKYALPQGSPELSSSDDKATVKPRKGGTKSPLDRNPSHSKTNLVWNDEFVGNGKPNPAFWFVNDEDAVQTMDHALHMQASSDSMQSTSSHLTTNDRVTFTYGTLEARIKVPDLTRGLWATFWTLGESREEGWPSVGEVTIMEMGYNETDPEQYINHRVRSSVHYDNVNGQYNTYWKELTSAEDFSEDFHVYRLEWTPETMATYVDDEWLWEIDINPEICPSCTELHEPHHIHLNLAVGGRFGCVVDCDHFASGVMEVDYVRLYDNGYMKGTINGYRNANWIKSGSGGSTTSSVPKSKGALPKIPVGGRRRLTAAHMKRTRKGARYLRNQQAVR